MSSYIKDRYVYHFVMIDVLKLKITWTDTSFTFIYCENRIDGNNRDCIVIRESYGIWIWLEPASKGLLLLQIEPGQWPGWHWHCQGQPLASSPPASAASSQSWSRCPCHGRGRQPQPAPASELPASPAARASPASGWWRWYNSNPETAPRPWDERANKEQLSSWRTIGLPLLLIVDYTDFFSFASKPYIRQTAGDLLTFFIIMFTHNILHKSCLRLGRLMIFYGFTSTYLILKANRKWNS